MRAYEQVRTQVAIAGRVVDERTRKPIGDAVVALAAVPATFAQRLAFAAMASPSGGATANDRPDRYDTDADGHFHFLDLPDGQYTVSASLPSAGTRYGADSARARVARNSQGKIAMATIELRLPPTTLKGQVTAADGAPVERAMVRLRISNEHTLTDAGGNYVLAGVETGSRTLLITARGYQPATARITLSSPGSARTVNVTLTPGTP